MAKDLLKVTRMGGESGLNSNQSKVFRALGLSKNRGTVLIEDTNATRGLVNKIIHWVHVELIAQKDSAKALEQMIEKKKKIKNYRVIQ